MSSIDPAGSLWRGKRLNGPGVGVTVLITCLVWLACDSLPTGTAPWEQNLGSPVVLTRVASAQPGEWNGPFGCVVQQRHRDGGVSRTAYEARFPENRVSEAKGEIATARARVVDHTGRLIRAIDCRVPHYEGVHGHVMVRFLPRGPNRASTFLVGLAEDPVLTGSVDLNRHRRVTGAALVPSSEAPPGCLHWDPATGCWCWLIEGVEVTECSEGSEDPACSEEQQPSDGGGFGGGTGGGGGGGSTTPIEVTLSCPDATRGSQVTCSLTSNGTIESATWTATSPNHAGWSRGSSSLSTWFGTAVDLTGVHVDATVGGVTKPLDVRFSALARTGWSWGPGDWTFQQGGLPPASIPSSYPLHSGSLTLQNTILMGINCSAAGRSGCVGTGVIDAPDVGQGSGPNGGLYYVRDPGYRMHRRTQLNWELIGHQPQQYTVTSAIQASCSGATLGSTVTWKDYNVQCHGVNMTNVQCHGVNMTGLINGAWAHEGYGGPGSGHQARGEAVAATVDIHLPLEDIVRTSSDAVRVEASNRTNPARTSITNAFNDTSAWSQNWGPMTLWLWDPATSNFVQATGLREH